MNRYQNVFSSLKKKKEAAFIPFAVAGDPDLDVSEQIFKAYINSGADILEIGYPFSDPVADGPVNQRAAQRAIASGLNHKSFFSLIKKIRSFSEIPIGLLLYANTVNHLGYDSFCRKASDAGIDSLLVADMPPEEMSELHKSMKQYGIGRVYIVSELTPVDRIKKICDQVDSFVYVVSRLGTTGVKNDLSDSVASTLVRLRKFTDKPLAVGFGLSTPDHIKNVIRAGADGAIVGSALVAEIEQSLAEHDDIIDRLKNKVAAFKAATIIAGS
jgi:tryptophan synthase alpha chain